MKHHLIFSHSHVRGEKYWCANHANVIAFIVAVLFTGMLLALFVLARTYIEPAM